MNLLIANHGDNKDKNNNYDGQGNTTGIHYSHFGSLLLKVLQQK